MFGRCLPYQDIRIYKSINKTEKFRKHNFIIINNFLYKSFNILEKTQLIRSIKRFMSCRPSV